MAMRMPLILLLVQAMSGAWLVEQARSSVVMETVRFKWLRARINVLTLSASYDTETTIRFIYAHLAPSCILVGHALYDLSFV